MNNKYLPVGTIVTLHNQKKPIIIVGYGTFDNALNINERIIYEYCGYPYPEGFLGDDKIISFNHDLIQTINHMGYKSPNYNDINQEITTMIENNKNGI